MVTSYSKALKRECLKLIRRHDRAKEAQARQRQRFKKRTGLEAPIPQRNQPLHWSLSPHFNPHKVRSRAASIEYGIKRSIATRCYEAETALAVDIPKPSGGSRRIFVLPLPDAAVSYWLATNLRERNQALFSSYAFAYRTDRTAQHAIRHLAREIKGRHRVYALEYDFAKYFDSIRHDYVLEVLQRYFDVSTGDLDLVQRLLRIPFARDPESYRQGSLQFTERGLPQGSCISLFLANVACHELDIELERLGVTFARFADDTVVLADDYDTAHAASELMLRHGERSGSSINFSKSKGIRILSETPADLAEITPTPAITFLGHEISRNGVRLGRQTLKNIRARISTFVDQSLISTLRNHPCMPNRLRPNPVDWDLVVCLYRIRTYLYGLGVTEDLVDRTLRGRANPSPRPSAFLFFPNVDATSLEDLRELDGWILSQVRRAYRHRLYLLRAQGLQGHEFTNAELRESNWMPSSSDYEVSVPSAARAWRYTRKLAARKGLAAFLSPNSASLPDDRQLYPERDDIDDPT